MSILMTVFVAGSGPAGISCTYALLKQGIKVTLLDGGIELEPERQKLVSELRKQPSHEWKESALGYLKGDLDAGTKHPLGIDQKLKRVKSGRWSKIDEKV